MVPWAERSPSKCIETNLNFNSFHRDGQSKCLSSMSHSRCPVWAIIRRPRFFVLSQFPWAVLLSGRQKPKRVLKRFPFLFGLRRAKKLRNLLKSQALWKSPPMCTMPPSKGLAPLDGEILFRVLLISCMNFFERGGARLSKKFIPRLSNALFSSLFHALIPNPTFSHARLART